MVLTLCLAGCAPITRPPSPEMVYVSESPLDLVGEKHEAVATNPGKVLLVVVGVFSALLVLLFIVTGGDLGGN
jgi:hypothetical protein